LLRSADNAADPLTREKPVCSVRDSASLRILRDSEIGWPRTEPIARAYVADGDGESDTDFLLHLIEKKMRIGPSRVLAVAISTPKTKTSRKKWLPTGITG
jgi:hypothetical protein